MVAVRLAAPSTFLALLSIQRNVGQGSVQGTPRKWGMNSPSGSAVTQTSGLDIRGHASRVGAAGNVSKAMAMVAKASAVFPALASGQLPHPRSVCGSSRYGQPIAIANEAAHGLPR